jgi:hypothetical protein
VGGLKEARRARNARGALLTVLFVFVVLGGLGVFGVKTSTASATAGGYRLTVIYPHVVRPGLAIGWEARVTHPGGFDGPVELATTLGYFSLFDFNNLQSLPDSVTNRGELTVWRFAAPPGDTLIVSMDARLAPAVQKGGSTTTSVLVKGVPVVSVRYETRVMP